ncbi:MAG TPA: YggS family pyridoxal phosphate-dependent enzyme [Acidobacteriota bacterium]|nr:YggS family pyridoxal phosphate-dependent enzyme [Acidobacteriota bacterium]
MLNKIMPESIPDNFNRIMSTVQSSTTRDVRLIAASKMVSIDRIRLAHQAGVKTFGENRMQEAIPKIVSCQDLDVDWHFIGHLQSNKAREAVQYFSHIHSVDSIKLMQHVEKEAARQSKKMKLLIELNLGAEATKHGLPEAELANILEGSRALHWCQVIGLMIIPPFAENPEEARPHFQKLRQLRDTWTKDFPALTELSMGMSHDYAIAVQEGATMIRIGTALFGPRPPRG